MSQTPLSISEVVSKLKNVLESHPDFQTLSCVGEISNLTKSRAGHWYFSLKDDKAKINCVMFQSATLKISTPIEQGDEVLIKGHMSVYAGTGQVQIIVNEMSLYGQGALYQKYLELRDRLHKQGYFNKSHKKELPTYPLSIGVVVGAQSAAQADIIKTLQTRWPVANVVQYESLVQGQLAATQLIKRLNQADEDDHDVILLARGGGSLEDLWAFNDVDLVMTIFNMKTPIITGVGHEIDITLVDYVADKRGLTPTDAALQATPHLAEVLVNVTQVGQQLVNRLLLRYKQAQAGFDRLYHQSLLSRPSMLLADYHLASKETSNKLNDFLYRFKSIVNEYDKKQSTLFTQISSFSKSHQANLDLYNQQILSKIKERQSTEQQRIELLKTQLDLKSPLTIMSKGYLVSYQNDHLVKSVHDIDPKKPMTLKYHDGNTVVEVKKEGV